PDLRDRRHPLARGRVRVVRAYGPARRAAALRGGGARGGLRRDPRAERRRSRRSDRADEPGPPPRGRDLPGLAGRRRGAHARLATRRAAAAAPRTAPWRARRPQSRRRLAFVDAVEKPCRRGAPRSLTPSEGLSTLVANICSSTLSTTSKERGC